MTTEASVPLDLASLRLRALQRDMSASADTRTPIFEAISQHLSESSSRRSLGPSASVPTAAAASQRSDEIRDAVQRRLYTDDEQRRRLHQRVAAAEQALSAAVIYQTSAAEMPRVGMPGVSAGALVERARSLVMAQATLQHSIPSPPLHTAACKPLAFAWAHSSALALPTYPQVEADEAARDHLEDAVASRYTELWRSALHRTP